MNAKENQGMEMWRLIEEAVFDAYGCLLPPGDASVPVVLPWTKEKYLGELKRKGKIISWAQDKDYAEGNLRRYMVMLDMDKI